MNSIMFKSSCWIAGSAAVFSLVLAVNGCSKGDDTKGTGSKDPGSTGTGTGTGSVTPDITPSDYLPFYIAFRKDGTPDVRVFAEGDWSARVDEVSADAFPIAAKIRRVESVTLVTYEGSCEILIPTVGGYKRIVIANDALCAKIKP